MKALAAAVFLVSMTAFSSSVKSVRTNAAATAATSAAGFSSATIISGIRPDTIGVYLAPEGCASAPRTRLNETRSISWLMRLPVNKKSKALEFWLFLRQLRSIWCCEPKKELPYGCEPAFGCPK